MATLGVFGIGVVCFILGYVDGINHSFRKLEKRITAAIKEMENDNAES